MRTSTRLTKMVLPVSLLLASCATAPKGEISGVELAEQTRNAQRQSVCEGPQLATMCVKNTRLGTYRECSCNLIQKIPEPARF